VHTEFGTSKVCELEGLPESVAPPAGNGRPFPPLLALAQAPHNGQAAKRLDLVNKKQGAFLKNDSGRITLNITDTPIPDDLLAGSDFWVRWPQTGSSLSPVGCQGPGGGEMNMDQMFPRKYALEPTCRGDGDGDDPNREG